jgi:hypothetical protein
VEEAMEDIGAEPWRETTCALGQIEGDTVLSTGIRISVVYTLSWNAAIIKLPRWTRPLDDNFTSTVQLGAVGRICTWPVDFGTTMKEDVCV